MKQPYRARHARALVAICSAVALLLAVGCSQSQTTSTTKNDTTAKNGHHAKLNEVVKVGTIWQMQLTGVQTSTGENGEQPEGGDVYLILALHIVNATGQSQDLYTVTTFTLLNAKGQIYTPSSLSFVSTPDGTIAAHATASGSIAFEVPASLSQFTLAFNSISGQGYWDISVAASN